MDSVPTDFQIFTYPDGSEFAHVYIWIVLTPSEIYTTFSKDRMYSYVFDCLSLGEVHEVSSCIITVSRNRFPDVFESLKNLESKPKYTFKKR